MNNTSKLFTHVDDGGQPGMVDISSKPPSVRRAQAEALIIFPKDALAALRDRAWESAKGPVWHTALIAGTQAVKNTSALIPFCHPLPIDGCRFKQEETARGLRITCEVTTVHKTGVEMEALTGVSVAALTVIDMCKAVTPYIRIEQVRLLGKSGGKREVKVS